MPAGEGQPGGGTFDYTRWIQLIAAMLRSGFTADETAKIAAGKYLRILPRRFGSFADIFQSVTDK